MPSPRMYAKPGYQRARWVAKRSTGSDVIAEEKGALRRKLELLLPGQMYVVGEKSAARLRANIYSWGGPKRFSLKLMPNGRTLVKRTV